MTESPTTETKHGRTGWVGRTVASPFFWVLVIGFMFVMPIVRTLQLQEPAPVDQLGPVLPFQLLDESNKPFDSQELENRIWVATMVCSGCPDVNPTQMDILAKIRGKTKNMVDAFRLVSFSVDSKTDRPEKMMSLETEHGLSRRWIFLTSDGGTDEPIEAALENIFGYDESHRHARNASRAPGELPKRLAHTIALVDRRMCVRAYYDLREVDVVEQLMGGINKVLHAGGTERPCIGPPG